MKQFQIIKAYKAINKLYEKDLPVSISYKLFRIRSFLLPHWEFQQDKERSVFDKYSPTVDENGSLKFGTKEDGERFVAEYTKLCNELADIDVDTDDIEKVSIPMDINLSLSVEDIEALQGFVEFVE